MVTRGERGQFQSWAAAALAERTRRALEENDALVADAIAALGLTAYRAWAAGLSRETIPSAARTGRRSPGWISPTTRARAIGTPTTWRTARSAT